MSDVAVPDISKVNTCECPSGSCGISEEDDINWCTGFWNELVRENPPSLYPESPIFSSKLYDWNDPVFLDNVFICPDVEEVLSGAHLSEYPAFIDMNFDTKSDEDLYSIYPTANPCDTMNSSVKISPPTNAPKQKKRRQRKTKSDDEHCTPSKRKSTGSARKTRVKK